MSALDDFIAKSIKRWGKQFDYSHCYYVNSTTKVNIICPTHGKFEQSPDNHLIFNGCEKCAPSKQKIANELFIAKSKEIYEDEYLYHKTHFKAVKYRVCITCKVHGDFMILPRAHLNPRRISCPTCAMEHSE